ncbi:hypothetical protein SAMN05892883_2314 [Jatrophihabitans sp. GAS493]|uniref:hypothetical protein n=1 Tax=Jatrophihabitans sp. GAS493 TaxID=1907575 RepID=UPI000BB68596|nr:hypothetical protein [Jatrophihabitans sp. GAS493]SOD73006.1 hypothetical protein SAMN05892883_2314 [Jatrophihabitans sp. GAS493]
MSTAVGDDLGDAPVRREWSWPRFWSSYWLPPALWFLFACIAFSEFLAHPTRSLPGGADGVLFAWYFESVQHSLWHLQNPLFSDAMNTPTGLNVMWNTALIIVSTLMAPLTALIGAVATAGLMMLLAPVLSATCAYLVFRRLSGHPLASALGATLYGFGPFFVGQAGHLHLTFAAPALPLIFYLGYQLFVTQPGNPRRIGCQLGGLVAVAMLVSEEVVAIVAIIAVIATVIAVVLNLDVLRDRLRYAVIGLAWAIPVAVVLLAIPLGYQFYGPLTLNEGIPGYQSLDVAGLVTPSALQRFATSADIAANYTYPAGGVENTGYLGWPLLAFMAALLGLLVIRRTRFAIWWLITAVASVALSFGAVIYINGRRTDVAGPWQLVIEHLPLLESLVAVRITLATTFLVALVIAFGLAAIQRRRNYLIGCGAAALALLTLFPAQRYDGMLNLAQSSFFSGSGVKAIPAGSATLVLPLRAEPNASAQVMYWQIQSDFRFKMVGGYSVFSVDGTPAYLVGLPKYATVLQETDDTGRLPAGSDVTLARISAATTGVRYIVLTSELQHRDLVAAAAVEITGCTPRPVADVLLCQVPLP